MEHSFFSGVKRDGDAEWIADGSPVFLWVNIGRDSVGRVRESAVDLLRSLFEEADSVIVYGREFVRLYIETARMGQSLRKK